MHHEGKYDPYCTGGQMSDAASRRLDMHQESSDGRMSDTALRKMDVHHGGPDAALHQHYINTSSTLHHIDNS